jgi:hypothetical protein
VATATHVTLADLVKRLKALPEDEQLYYVYHFLALIDADEKFDAAIQNTPPEVMQRFMDDLDREVAAGTVRPLTEADFALEDE